MRAKTEQVYDFSQKKKTKQNSVNRMANLL